MSDPQTDILVKAAAGLFTEIFKGAYKTSLGWIKGKNETHDFFNKKAEAYGKKMAKRYNSMKVLGMSEPRPLSSIFVRANILKKITTESFAKIEDLKDQFDYEKRGFGEKKETKPGLEVAQKLQKFIVLGKPGAGKTTFLKRIVLHSLEGDFTYSRLPIFVGLKEYSESKKTLFEYIVQEFDICSLPDAEPFIINLLKNGKGQILLDGLDEVKKENEDRVIQEIKNLSAKFDSCQYILSCRIAAFNVRFEHFTDVEMADFNDQQIEQFITNWFATKPIDGEKMGKECWEKLKANPQTKEIASSPILLTLLCISYDDALDFPQNRAFLYDEAIETLLKKWDTTRGIKRDGITVYQSLNYSRRKALLSQVAFQSFSQGEFFIPRSRLEKLIGGYIENLPQVKEKPIEVESSEVLTSIIAQHGLIVPRAKQIYSFSHLTFQEYFTAHFLASSQDSKRLIKYAIEGYSQNPQWREVFLLTAGMLENADHFMISFRKYIDQYAIEHQLITFLSQTNTVIKLDSYLSEQRGRGRGFGIYFVLNFAFILILDAVDRAGIPVNASANALNRTLESALTLALDLAKDNTLDFAFARYRTLERVRDQNRNVDREFDSQLDLLFDHSLDLDLARELAHVHDPDPTIETYIKLNQFLLDCLNSGAYVSKSVRADILDNLLLPPKEKKPKKKKKPKNK